MANQYKNKVVYNGTTLIDLSDTTAVQSDVASGKFFYLATGEKVEGTNSGGGDEPSEPTYETYFDDSITIDAYISIPSLADLYFAEGETWRVTWDGVEYICTTTQYQGWLWTIGNQSLATSADDGINEPFLLYNYGSGAMNGNARTGGTHTLKLEKQTSSGSGGGSGGGGSTNPLSGKILSATGDSIAAGSGNNGSGYPELVASDNNMTLQNVAVGGGTVAYVNANTFCISRSISSMRSDADFVLLEGGSNDADSGVPLGTLSSGYTATLDDTTFAGAIESMFKSAIARFPDKKIGYVFIHKCASLFDSRVSNSYYDMAKSACEKWGIPYLDLNTQVPPLNYIADLKSTYTANADGYHPNELGYRTFYVPKITAFLNTMLTDKSLINKTVTANGTYLASDDSADGYSSVTVNVSGGGGGASYDGIEIKTSGTTVTEYACHMSTIPDFALNYIDFTKGVNDGLSQITFPVKPTHVGKRAFFQAKARIDWSGLSDMETADEYALASAYISQADWTGDEVTLPSFVGYTSSHNAQSLFRFDGSSAQTYCPKKYNLPVCEVIPQFLLYGIRASNIDVTIGSVGHAVTESKDRPFGSSSNASGAVVIYTTGTYLDSVKTAVQNGLGSNITLTFKASEATTYGGSSYAAGATILTV